MPASRSAAIRSPTRRGSPPARCEAASGSRAAAATSCGPKSPGSDCVAIDAIAAEVLDAVRARGTYRRLRVLAGAQAPRMRVEGREVLLFAGSNYLDLAHHPEVVEAAERAARDYGCASGGSRLICGNLDLHEALESELAKFLGRDAALAFATGYMANVG